MANKKNTYENLEQFCKRLAEEKFKNEGVSLTKKKKQENHVHERNARFDRKIT